MVAAVERYFEVLNGADPELLRDVLAADFRDDDPFAPPGEGVEGVIERVRLYRAALPDARSVVEEVVAEDEGALVSWTTTATGLDGSTDEVSCRYVGRMVMRGSRIQSHQVVSVMESSHLPPR